MNGSFEDYAQGFVQLRANGGTLVAAAPELAHFKPPAANAPVCLVFAPHPDDEAIFATLPLRLRHEDNWRVVNVPITLGSRLDRRAARWQEMQNCCTQLGFEVASVTGKAGQGLEQVQIAYRRSAPTQWAANVAGVAKLIKKYKPTAIVCPHAQDGHPVHMGTYWLVLDALHLLAPKHPVHLLLAEYWNTQMQPGLMVQASTAQVGHMLSALMQHTGEVARNPYHLTLPAWLMDGVRRGAERVGAPGSAAPNFGFAALYGWQLYRAGRLRKQNASVLASGQSAGAFFTSPLAT
jgi:N-acetylglucosamine malate deacetylase 1